ncbi:MAG: ABC transporter substrate-binding protein [Chthoniobacterales bacterium]
MVYLQKRPPAYAILTLLLFLSNTQVSVAAPPAAENKLTPITLQLKWKHQFQFAGYYAAIEKGYYRDAGLDVTLKEAEPNQDPVNSVINGTAQFGVGTSELILLRNQKKPVVVLATIYQHSPLILLARADGETQDIQSLHDKPIMIEPQSAELFAYFKYEGVDPAKLNIIHHTYNVEDLIAGKVKAISAYSTDEPYILNKAKIKAFIFSPREGGIDFYGDNLFTTEQMLKEHPKDVHVFLSASLKGWEYAMSHPEEIVDLILRKYNTQGKTREQLLFEAEHTAQLMHPGLIEVGHMNKGRWQHIADTYAEFDMLPKGFSLNGFLYEKNLPPSHTWIYWLVMGILLATLAALFWLLPLIQLNRSLRSEIKERHHVESRLRTSEEQYRNLAEKVPFAVTITDLETNLLVFANQRSTDMMETTAEAAVGHPPMMYHVNLVDREFIVGEIRAGKMVKDFELALRTVKTGKLIWVLLSATLVEFSNRQCMVAAFQDITQQRNMQEELKAAKDAAEAAHASKSSYLAVMSHELRSPLSGIIGLAHLMKEAIPKNSDQEENLDLIASTSEGLLKLISDILDHSKLQAGRVNLEMEPVETAGFLRELTRLFFAPAHAKNITFHSEISPDVPAVIITDSMRLRQILGNLLTNAIKFTEAGNVDIKVSAHRASGEKNNQWRLRFEVRDTGIGISPEEIGQLFQPYSQTSTARRYGGTGLGLAISRDLAQLLGGELSAQSTPGKGSLFTLEILAQEA